MDPRKPSPCWGWAGPERHWGRDTGRRLGLSKPEMKHDPQTKPDDEWETDEQ